jgi:Major Facilitator Superfamily
MQSILQYRRFEKRLRQQIDRHGVDDIAGYESKEPAIEQKDEEDAEQSEANVFPQSSEHEVGPSTKIEQEKDIELGDVSSEDDGRELSGSTTRESSSSDRPRPVLSTVTTRDSKAGSHLGNMGTRLGNAMTGVDVRLRTTNEGGREKGKLFIVGFAGPDDPLNPHNWSKTRRMIITIIVAFIGLIVGFASSVDSAVLQQARQELHVGEVAESLATGLYLVGFGVGAFFAAPISETVGRNPVYIVTMTLFMIFVMASGLAPNLGAQLTFRFLAGFFGSTPLTCAGGSISDMWTAEDRTVVFPIFANAAFWLASGVYDMKIRAYMITIGDQS